MNLSMKWLSEFVDLDYKKARKYARYAVVTNSVYTGQDFADIPECFSGVMFMPQIGKKGSVFNPEFVKYKFDLKNREWTYITKQFIDYLQGLNKW